MADAWKKRGKILHPKCIFAEKIPVFLQNEFSNPLFNRITHDQLVA
jgi:hypothetical protein